MSETSAERGGSAGLRFWGPRLLSDGDGRVFCSSRAPRLRPPRPPTVRAVRLRLQSRAPIGWRLRACIFDYRLGRAAGPASGTRATCLYLLPVGKGRRSGERDLRYLLEHKFPEPFCAGKRKSTPGIAGVAETNSHGLASVTPVGSMLSCSLGRGPAVCKQRGNRRNGSLLVGAGLREQHFCRFDGDQPHRRGRGTKL
jgi:hypothetical protein